MVDNTYNVSYQCTSILSIILLLNQLPCLYILTVKHLQERNNIKKAKGGKLQDTVNLPLRMSFALIIGSLLLLIHSTAAIMATPNTIHTIEVIMLWTISIDAGLVMYLVHAYCYSLFKAFRRLNPNDDIRDWKQASLIAVLTFQSVVILLDTTLVTIFNSKIYYSLTELVLNITTFFYANLFVYLEHQVIRKLINDESDKKNINRSKIRFHFVFTGMTMITTMTVMLLRITTGALNFKTDPYFTNTVPQPILIWGHIALLYIGSAFTIRNTLTAITARNILESDRKQSVADNTSGKMYRKNTNVKTKPRSNTIEGNPSFIISSTATGRGNLKRTSSSPSMNVSESSGPDRSTASSDAVSPPTMAMEAVGLQRLSVIHESVKNPRISGVKNDAVKSLRRSATWTTFQTALHAYGTFDKNTFKTKALPPLPEFNLPPATTQQPGKDVKSTPRKKKIKRNPNELNKPLPPPPQGYSDNLKVNPLFLGKSIV